MELVKKERPKVIESITEVVTTGCGKLYITVGFEPDGHPIEIRASLGKSGGCSESYLDALLKSISLGLQRGIPGEEFAEELIGNECPSKNMWPEDERILSCADGIGKVLKKYLEAVE